MFTKLSTDNVFFWPLTILSPTGLFTFCHWPARPNNKNDHIIFMETIIILPLATKSSADDFLRISTVH